MALGMAVDKLVPLEVSVDSQRGKKMLDKDLDTRMVVKLLSVGNLQDKMVLDKVVDRLLEMELLLEQMGIQ